VTIVPSRPGGTPAASAIASAMNGTASSAGNRRVYISTAKIRKMKRTKRPVT